jgi:DNA polymerase-3 subunit alpha
MKIEVYPPDINKSILGFSLCENGIRFGLAALKNLGEGLIGEIIRERDLNGDYSSLENLINRTKTKGLTKKAIESLIFSGTLDSFGVFRSRLYSVMPKLIDQAAHQNNVNLEGQLDLFGQLSAASDTKMEIQYPDIPEYPKDKLLSLEKEICGFYLSGDPLERFSLHAKEFGCVQMRTLSPTEDTQGRRIISVLGQITKKNTKKQKDGKVMCFAQLEDAYSSVELIFFSQSYSKYADIIIEACPLLVKGELTFKDDSPKIKVYELMLPIPNESFIPSKKEAVLTDNGTKAAENSEIIVKKTKLYLRFEHKEDKIEKEILSLFSKHPGEADVYFFYADEKKLFKADGIKSEISEFVLSKIRKLIGDENVATK